VQFGENLPTLQLNLPLPFGYKIEAKKFLSVASIHVEGYITSYLRPQYSSSSTSRKPSIPHDICILLTNWRPVILYHLNFILFLRKMRVKLRDDFISVFECVRVRVCARARVCVRACASTTLKSRGSWF
jgi:hypothetical protein